MKILQTLLILVLFATPLYAEQAGVLTEIEQIQEKIWYLQKDLAAEKTSHEQQQKRLDSLSSKTTEGQLALQERLSLLAESIATQQKVTLQMENRVEDLKQELTALTNEIVSQNSARQEFTRETRVLEETLQALQAEYASKQATTEQALAEMVAQLEETRSQLQSMEQKLSGRGEQLWLWVAVAALVLAVALTISLSLRKKSVTVSPTELKQPPRHEM